MIHDPADPIRPTPEHLLKPKLVFAGKLMGMDLYIDVHGQRDEETAQLMVLNLLRQQFYPPAKEAANGNA